MLGGSFIGAAALLALAAFASRVPSAHSAAQTESLIKLRTGFLNPSLLSER